MQKVDLAIVGGGMVGLTLARALKDTGVKVALVNNGPLKASLPEEPLLRVSAINQANHEAFRQLGVWQHIPAERLAAYTKMQVWDQDSFGRIEFDCADVPATQLGHIVENQVLVNALAESINQQPNVQVSQSSISKILWGQQETMLMLDNDDVIACKLVVGADGASSMIRRQCQFPLTFRDYGHTAIVANIRCEQPHDFIARQVFTPAGPLALLPMADPHTCSIVWSQDHERATALMALDDDEFSHELTATSASVLGVFKVASSRHSFALNMQYARQWAKDGAVIIGDAAHTIHPLAGQGANLGIQDALRLGAYILELISKDKDYSRLRYLRPFERERKAQAIKVLAAMDGFKLLFDGNNPLKKLMRGAGLIATDKATPLKRQWIKHAMGG